MNFSLNTNNAQRELIAQLESKNREIMREIQRLRIEQEVHAKNTADAQYNPMLMAELRLLRQRKDELENRMQALQESRKDLVVQLETLMKLLKNQPTSPRSTPQDSPRGYSASSPPLAPVTNPTHQSMTTVTTPATPGTDSYFGTNTSGRTSAPISTANTPAMESSTLSGFEDNVHLAFMEPSTAALNVRNLRNDLLVAADSITGAMSSLVKELNSDHSEDDDDNLNGDLEIAENYMMQTREDLESWQREVQKRLNQETKFIAELRSKQPHHSANSSGNNSENGDRDLYDQSGFSTLGSVGLTDDSYVRTDDESIVRTDDDDAELYDNHPKELPNEMTSSRHSEDDGYFQSDAESYIRTDDEDAGNTESDWEESMKRWINR